MREPVVVQQPAGIADQLILLFHGVGSTPQNMLPLGQWLASQFPQSAVISVSSPDPCDIGPGFQWFSVRGVTEENRVQRVADTMPRFVNHVHLLQGSTGTTPMQTTLIGFSQGAIMALESTQQEAATAGRVIAVAGRFAQPPRVAPAHTLVHLLHGEQDNVMPIGLAVDAQARLTTLGAVSTLDRFPGLGHGIDERVIEIIRRRLASATPEAAE